MDWCWNGCEIKKHYKTCCSAISKSKQININETRTIKDKKIQLLIKLYLATIKQEHKQETLILNKQNNKISKRTLQGILKKIGYTTKQIKESE